MNDDPRPFPPHLKVRFLGQTLDIVTMDDLNLLIARAIDGGDKIVVGNQNLHALYLAQRDPYMRRFLETAHVVHVDGMALVALARLFGLPVERRHRVTYIDWLHPLMQLAVDRRWRVFYLGGAPGVAEDAAAALRATYPQLQLATHHGFFDATPETAANADILAEISSFQTELLLVGMGMPRQERWVVENLPAISANAILMAGACFDYVAGVARTPPRWAGRIGLEWLFRLAAEPKRLAPRYLLEPWTLLPLIAREVRSRSTDSNETGQRD